MELLAFLAIIMLLLVLFTPNPEKDKEEVRDFIQELCKPHSWIDFNGKLRCANCGFIAGQDAENK